MRGWSRNLWGGLLGVSVVFGASESALARAFPDRGSLTINTRITEEGGIPKFRFSDNVNSKWPDTSAWSDKRNALGQVLIFRKQTIEFLLLARERLRALGVAFGMEQTPERMAPTRLTVAL